MPDTTVTIGTVIHGTLRDEDLLLAFADELERVGGPDLDQDTRNGSELIAEARALVPNGLLVEDTYENAPEAVHDLMDALQEYAPAHMYFGSIEGDGADFGWWTTGEWGDCQQINLTGNSRAKDCTFVDVDCQLYVEINDHGNVTVSELRGKEIWSAV